MTRLKGVVELMWGNMTAVSMKSCGQKFLLFKVLWCWFWTIQQFCCNRSFPSRSTPLTAIFSFSYGCGSNCGSSLWWCFVCKCRQGKRHLLWLSAGDWMQLASPVPVISMGIVLAFLQSPPKFPSSLQMVHFDLQFDYLKAERMCFF